MSYEVCINFMRVELNSATEWPEKNFSFRDIENANASPSLHGRTSNTFIRFVAELFQIFIYTTGLCFIIQETEFWPM